MLSNWFGSHRLDSQSRRAGRGKTASHPQLEGLESRLLLYSTLGANWTYGSRITYSFVPDGTNIGGLTSNLYATLNAKYSTATWQAQFQKAAAYWETYANINLANVTDNGAMLASGLYQQGDPNMGDIRISMVSLPSSQLAFTFLPPPINGGSDSGDIVFNSNINWQINANYDLLTVALHEFGHALGMDHSTYTSADMYPTYTGIKQSPSSDDIAGIQSIYGAPQPDQFDSGSSNNNNYTTATNITSYLDSYGQIALSGVNINTSSDCDWYYVTAPSTTNGTLTVTMQSSNLSSLSPRMVLYNSSLAGLGQASAPNTYGATVSVTVTGVTPGQGFYIRALPASSPGAVGAYGLLVNFGSCSQSPIAPPNTQVLDQVDQGGGSESELTDSLTTSGNVGSSTGWFHHVDLTRFQVGSWAGWGDGLAAAANPASLLPTGIQATNVSATTTTNPGGLASLGSSTFLTTWASPPQTQTTPSGQSGNSLNPTSHQTVPSSLVLQAIDKALTGWNSDQQHSLIDDPEESSAV